MTAPVSATESNEISDNSRSFRIVIANNAHVPLIRWTAINSNPRLRLFHGYSSRVNWTEITTNPRFNPRLDNNRHNNNRHNNNRHNNRNE